MWLHDAYAVGSTKRCGHVVSRCMHLVASLSLSVIVGFCISALRVIKTDALGKSQKQLYMEVICILFIYSCIGIQTASYNLEHIAVNMCWSLSAWYASAYTVVIFRR